MKKILITLLLTLFSFVLFAQESELSDYEKYRIEKEKEPYQIDEEVFYIVEDMPKFQGEDGKEFRKWITQNVVYPQEAIKDGITGKVIVSFVVNKSGEVVNAKIEKSINKYLDAEAIRVVMSSPKWVAGKQRGETVNVQFTFPINFVLDNQEQSEPVVINNYYNNYNQPDYRFLLTFGYSYPYYNHYYDPWYSYGYGYPSYGAWYGGYYNYYAYYGMYYPYYGYNFYSHHHSYWYYSHNYNNRNWYSRPQRPRYIQNPKDYITRNPVRTGDNPVRREVPSTTRTTRPSDRTATTTRTSGERNYTPTYNKVRTNSRSEYNRSVTRTTTQQPQRTVQVQRQSQQRSTYVRPTQSQTRSSSTYSRPSSSSRSQSYSTPSRSSSSYRSAPSRSSGSYSSGSSGASRSSGSSGSRSSGGASRSSSGGSRR